MELIDEEGNLFGAINVIDALAILLVVAVVVAGLALVVQSGGSSDSDTGPSEPDTATRYATIALGNHVNHKADRITTGDTMQQDGHNLTVTDVHSAPVDKNKKAVTVRVELDGELADESPNEPRFQFGGNRLRVHNEMSIKTDEYGAKGRIQSLEETGSELQTDTISAEIQLNNINPDTAAAISEGMTQTSRGEPLVTVQSVSTQPAEVVLQSDDGNIYERDHPTNRDLRLTVSLRTIETESGDQFNSGPLRIGDSITLDLDTVTVKGTVSDLE